MKNYIKLLAVSVLLFSCNEVSPEYDEMHKKRMLDLEYYSKKIEVMDKCERAKAIHELDKIHEEIQSY